MGSRASGEERSQKLDMDMEIRYVDHSEVRTTCDSTLHVLLAGYQH